MKKDTVYYYKVRGYSNSNGKKTYRNYSDVCSAKTIKAFPHVTADELTGAHLNLHDKSLLDEAYILECQTTLNISTVQPGLAIS